MSLSRLATQVALVATLTLTIFGAASAQSVRVIDVLGVYPDHVAAKVSDPVAMFVHNIEYSNRTLQNSGANYRYNLVHVQQINWANDAGLGGSQLSSLRENAAIASLRDQYGADLVAGIVPQSNGLCGIAYLAIKRNSTELHPFGANYAHSLTGHSCGGRSMAHEMGHNLGLGHSYAQGSSGTLAPWARGHGVQDRFVTIMAYSSAYGIGSGGRLQIHATPTRTTCTNLPCGLDFRREDGADAVRAINLGSAQIEDYRQSKNVDPNLAPDAVADRITTDQGQSVTTNLLVNDSDPDGDAISIVSVSEPNHGTTAIVNNQGAVRYLPDPDFYGNDAFEYVIQDAKGARASARVDVVVNRVIVPPTGPTNLIVNSGIESDVSGWSGIWGMQVNRTTQDAIEGRASLAARGGYGVTSEMLTPFSGSRSFKLTSKIAATQSNHVYLYTRILSDGQWRYQYLGYQLVRAGQISNVSKTFELADQRIDDGYLLYYFPYRARGVVRIDSTRLAPQ